VKVSMLRSRFPGVFVSQSTVQNNISLTILFADIAGSTRLYETLGDAAARRVVARVLSILHQVITQHGGTVVKTIGDEVMSVFADAGQAALASLEMQRSVLQAASSEENGARRISIRVGFHSGPVIRDGDDVFGDTVNVAARVVAQAKAQQVLTTQRTLSLLPPQLRSTSRFIDRVRLKGKEDELEIHEVIWDRESLTDAEFSSARRSDEPALLRIRFRDRDVELSQSCPLVRLGRGRENEIVVSDSRASRLHSRIELRRDKFVLIDQSINGTYVLVYGEREVHVRRDELPLRGSGVISLGRPADADSQECIHFYCES